MVALKGLIEGFKGMIEKSVGRIHHEYRDFAFIFFRNGYKYHEFSSLFEVTNPQFRFFVLY